MKIKKLFVVNFITIFGNDYSIHDNNHIIVTINYTNDGYIVNYYKKVSSTYTLDREVNKFIKSILDYVIPRKIGKYEFSDTGFLKSSPSDEI